MPPGRRQMQERPVVRTVTWTRIPERTPRMARFTWYPIIGGVAAAFLAFWMLRAVFN